jgi:hypothetical protein
MVLNGEVGAIALLIESRIGRDDADWAYLLKQCRRWGVLFIVNDSVEDPREKRGWLGLKVKGLFAELDNQDRSTMVTEAMKAKVAAGRMATPVAPGYALNRAGRLVKDRDPEVREAIEALFRIFAEEGSCGRAAERMKREGICIPTRQHKKRGEEEKGCQKKGRKNKIVFLPATEPAILRILHNPIHCGELWYPRFVPDPTKEPDSRGHYPRRPALSHETTIYRNHHEGYISPEEFRRNLERLRDNAPTPVQRSLGDGSALLQQKVRCECHSSRVLPVGYKPKRTRDGGCTHYYHCLKGHKSGAHDWSWIPGNLLDKVVTETVFRRYCGSLVDGVEAGVQEFRHELDTKKLEWEKELERATEESREFESRFSATQGQPRVRERVAAKWEEALARVEALKERLAGEPTELSLLNKTAFAELRGLLDELPILFWANTTEDIDRKRLLGCMVSGVFITEKTRERIKVRIAWQDGQPDKEVEIVTAAYAADVARQLATQRKSIDEIVLVLNEMGVLTRTLRSYSRESVRGLVSISGTKRADEEPNGSPNGENADESDLCR